MKKLISLLTVIAMVACLFAACGDPDSTTPTGDNGTTTAPTTPSGEVKITDGYYHMSIDGTYDCWMRLNEDGTYYASYFSGSVVEAGVWELVDEPTTYWVDSNGDHMAEEGDPEATSEQSIVFTSYTTGTPVYVAYADGTLWDMSLGSMANHRNLYHEPDFVYNADTMETPIQLYVYYANNDIGATFVLNHNKTFEDATGDMFDTGTWEMTGTGEYTLTYDFGGSATLVTSGATATVTKDDGTVIELKDDYKEDTGAVAKTLSVRLDDAQVGLPMSVGLRIDGYSDGTCQVIIEIAQTGDEIVIDQGTFEVSGAMKPTFHFENAGDIEGTPDYNNYGDFGIAINVVYSVETTVSDMPISIAGASLDGAYNPNATPEEPAPVVIATMSNDAAQVGLPMSVALRIDCYDDGTAKLVMFISQTGDEIELDSGTYEVSAGYTMTVHLTQLGDIVGVTDYANASEAGLPMTLTVTGSLTVSDMPLTLEVDLSGNYVPPQV